MKTSLYESARIPYLDDVLDIYPSRTAKIWKPQNVTETDSMKHPNRKEVDRDLNFINLNKHSVRKPVEEFENLLQTEYWESMKSEGTEAKFSRASADIGVVIRNTTQRLENMQTFSYLIKETDKCSAKFFENFETNGSSALEMDEMKNSIRLFFEVNGGDGRTIQEMISARKVNTDVCDQVGITPLITASVKTCLFEM